VLFVTRDRHEGGAGAGDWIEGDAGDLPAIIDVAGVKQRSGNTPRNDVLKVGHHAVFPEVRNTKARAPRVVWLKSIMKKRSEALKQEEVRGDEAIRQVIAEYGNRFEIVSVRTTQGASIDTRCIVRDTRKQKEFGIFDRRTLPLPALRDSIRQQLKAQSQER
jgi:hypothetical protein